MCNSDRSERFRLMIVEDQGLTAMDLQEMLEELGHEVLTVAPTVGRALEAIAGEGLPPDAAIVDANLGGDTAAPLADALRRRNIPFLVASGYSRDELSRMGFDEPLLSKPYRLDDVRNALSNLLSPNPPS